MNYNIEYLFPKSIIFADNICKDNLVNLKNTVDNIFLEKGSVRQEVLGVDSTHQTFNTLHKLDEFQPLVDSIFTVLKEFIIDMGYDEEFLNCLYISNMWANKSCQGDLLEDHIHESSLFSGSYYIESSKDSRIIFKDFTNMLPVPLNFTPSSLRCRWYETVPGRLVIFRSDMPHSTNKQSSTDRTVISFNIKEKHFE